MVQQEARMGVGRIVKSESSFRLWGWFPVTEAVLGQAFKNEEDFNRQKQEKGTPRDQNKQTPRKKSTGCVGGRQ